MRARCCLDPLPGERVVHAWVSCELPVLTWADHGLQYGVLDHFLFSATLPARWWHAQGMCFLFACIASRTAAGLLWRCARQGR